MTDYSPESSHSDTKMTTIFTPEQIQSRKHFSAISREGIEREAERDKSKPASETTLWKTIRGCIINNSSRYTAFPNSISFLEWDMHDLWHMIIASASVTPADDAGQDRLVAQVLYAREIGTISRTITTTIGQFQEGVTSDGLKFWKDLPYLVQDFREFWSVKSMEMDAVRRCNLVAFMARLTALGICDEALSSCALSLFKETFEVQRPVTRQGTDVEMVPLLELVPACLVWLRYCSHKLLILAVENYSFADVSGDVLEPGELARNVDIEQEGFNVNRWIFWRTRFKDMCRSGDEKLFADGKSGHAQMMRTGTEMGLKVLGEAEYQERVAKFLKKKLQRTGAGMVSGEDMPVFSDEE